jgi:vacuolar-type H+-ATPase subunit E/Vma4
MGDMGGQIDKMVSFIHFEAKNKKEEILAKAKQDKEAKKLEAGADWPFIARFG